MNSWLSSLVPQGCPACLPRPLATMMQSISCQQHSAWRRSQNLTQTIKTTEICVDPCGLHFFILPEAFAQQSSCLYYEKHKGKKGFIVLPFFWSQEHPSLNWIHLICPCFFLAYTGIHLFCFNSVQPIPQCLVSQHSHSSQHTRHSALAAENGSIPHPKELPKRR